MIDLKVTAADLSETGSQSLVDMCFSVMRYDSQVR